MSLMEKLNTELKIGRMYSKTQLEEFLGEEGINFCEAVGNREPRSKFGWMNWLFEFEETGKVVRK